MAEEKSTQLRFVPPTSGENALVPEVPKKKTPKDFPPPTIKELPLIDPETGNEIREQDLLLVHPNVKAEQKARIRKAQVAAGLEGKMRANPAEKD